MFKYCIFSLFIVTGAFAEDPYALDHATVSIYAVNHVTGKILFDQNSHLSLVPDSCLKIVTTGAALQLLGKDKRFETHLEYDGSIDNEKTLHGNVYIHGGGDPTLGSDRFSGSLSWNKQIEAWTTALQKRGIKKIEGKVIGDATKWEKAMAVPSWQWEDLGNYYGAGASALTFNENKYFLFFTPGHNVGDDAVILRTDPPLLTTLSLQNEVKTGPEGSGDQAWIFGSEFSSTHYVRGTIPAAVKEFSIKGALPDPAALCAELLTQALLTGGISVDQKVIGPQKERVDCLTTYSPTVGEIVHWTNQVSHNLFAEHLLKKMGEEIFNEGSTQAGIKAVTNFWKSQNIDLSGFNMVDGSGLSRKNLVTAKQFVSMLIKMRSWKDFPVFFQSLPLIETPMRAKDGSMSLMRGYVGYTGDITFAIIVNQCTDRPEMLKKIKTFLSDINQIK